MSVFGTDAAALAFLRDAAVAAAWELGVFAVMTAAGREPRRGMTCGEIATAVDVVDGQRIRALLDALVALDVIGKDGERFWVDAVPAPERVIADGWGAIAAIVRADAPVPAPNTPKLALAFHVHLAEAGAAAARELVEMYGDAASLADLGGGLGTYAAAFLDAANRAGAKREREDAGASEISRGVAGAEGEPRETAREGERNGEHGLRTEEGSRNGEHGPGTVDRARNGEHGPRTVGGARRATVVDVPEVIDMARAPLARFGGRARTVAGDVRDMEIGQHDAAVLANVLHLHGPDACAELCAAAARAVRPGGRVVVHDLRLDEDRRGPLAGVLFAMNMGVYTSAGDVYRTSQIVAWLADAGLEQIEERRLASAPDSVVVIGVKPASVFERIGGVAASEYERLRTDGRLRDEARPPALDVPLALAHVIERAAAVAPEQAEALASHYADAMPRARIAQIASIDEPGATFFHEPLAWERLPRMSAAIERLYALLADVNLDSEARTRALGAPDAVAFRARMSTLAALYERTHYGGLMPLLYGAPADLAHFALSGASTIGQIDRYFPAPVMHELAHFARDRAVPLPLHLDECIGGWIGVHAHPEMAYPAAGEDDAIYAAPWLAQVGQAVARAFGVRNVVRAHAGAVGWRDAVPAAFVDAAVRLGWDDWKSRRPLHFLADTMAPRPWIALAFAAAAGRDVQRATLASLAKIDIADVDIAERIERDDVFDRRIVEDALRAMCLENVAIHGSLRARTSAPSQAIRIDAIAASVSTPRRTPLDLADLWYWLPPAVASRMRRAGVRGYELRIEDIAAVGQVADAICAARGECGGTGFELRGIAM